MSWCWWGPVRAVPPQRRQFALISWISRVHHWVQDLLWATGGVLTAETLIASDDIASEWYVRLTVADRPGVMSNITQTLADREISIESLVQKALLAGQTQVPIVCDPSDSGIRNQ